MNRLRNLVYGTAALIALQAGADPVLDNHSDISGKAARGQSGRMAINMAAGDGNAQLNAAALAISTGLGTHALLDLRQKVDISGADPTHNSVSAISDSAFSHSSGTLSINQVSGLGNAQINSIAIGFGLDGKAVTDTQLSSSVTGYSAGLAPDDAGHREVRIEDEAFKGSSGLVQVNQLAGTANATANSFQLRINLGVKSEQ
ncbi:hypothetical protein [Marinobacterium rhizophilum]|uniref:Adhesin n=1 Tax=Marinobacterium rhizophilum TaxID=420402 RepID=A0ABY5HJT5_9GAMM|nr:hypothetical protein [Marinobacterium rhizophilum]UTW12550.1 hypothetical protein KDW95_02370 [Marinobacterium rhizophilum]